MDSVCSLIEIFSLYFFDQKRGSRMSYREKTVSFNRFGSYHKGFYNNDGDSAKALLGINYTGFLKISMTKTFLMILHTLFYQVLAIILPFR